MRKGDVELSTNPLAFESARSEQAVGRDRPDSASGKEEEGEAVLMEEALLERWREDW